MSAIFRVILTSVSGAIIGILFYGLTIGLIIFILDKVDKSAGWIGVIQNPAFTASIFGALFGGVVGFLIGLVIGIFKTTGLLKGAFVGFVVTELLIIIGLAAFSLTDFRNFNNFNRLTDSIISVFFLFLILTMCFFIPSVLIGAATVRLKALISPILSKIKNDEKVSPNDSV